MSTIVLDKTQFKVKVEDFTELWLAVHSPELQGRTRCELGQQKITVPIHVTMLCTNFWFFDSIRGGDLLKDGHIQIPVKVHPGDTLVLKVHWEGW